MGIADGMKDITRDIISCYDVRVKTLGNLVADTKEMLNGFAQERKKMSNFVGSLSKSVEHMLKEFQKNHKDMSNDQAKNLEDFMKSLTKGVGSMLNGFHKERTEMSAELQEELAQGEKERTKMSAELQEKLAREVKDIETYVEKMLKEFSHDHADMREELRKDLDKYAHDMVSGVRKLLGEYHSDMRKARAAWQGMACALAGSRKEGVMPRIKAGEKVTTVGGMLRKTAKVGK
jgi:DNA anti-recombination protein RmuC